MSLLDQDQRERLGVGLDLAGRLLGELLPGLSGPVARGLLGAMREVLRSGREPEEIVAYLQRLTIRGAARLDVDEEAARVAEELRRGLP